MRANQIQQVLKPLKQSSSQVYLGQGLHTLGLLGWILEQTGPADEKDIERESDSGLTFIPCRKLN